MANAILKKADDTARRKIGYLEGPKNNETMFGKWFGMNFVAWCAIFQSWVSFMSGTTYFGEPWRFASTIAARAHAIKNNRWTSTPTVGTIAMMVHTSTTGHVGWVSYILNRKGKIIVGTIEGNTNDQGGREGNGVWIRERDASSWNGYIVLDQTYLKDEEIPAPGPVEEEDDMKLHYYRIRDENDITKGHPTLGGGIWVSDGITTNIMSEAQYVHGGPKGLKWYEENIELIPETFHNALVATSQGGNTGSGSIQELLNAIKNDLDNPDTHAGEGSITKEAIDEITKSVLDAQAQRLSS